MFLQAHCSEDQLEITSILHGIVCVLSSAYSTPHSECQIIDLILLSSHFILFRFFPIPHCYFPPKAFCQDETL